MTQKYNAMALLQMKDYALYLIQNKDTMFTIDVQNRTLTMEGKWLLPNIILWRPLLKRNMPVFDRHIVYNEDMTEKCIQRINDQIYIDVRQYFPDDAINVCYDFLEGINEMYNIGARYLGQYHNTVSGMSLYKVMEDPEIKEAVSETLDEEMRYGIQAVEEKIGEIYKQTQKCIINTDINNNVMYGYVKFGIVNQQQLSQVLCVAGTRTDVNEMTLRLPIKSSYFKGLQNICEVAADSLSAKKSLFYSDNATKTSQWGNRREQLLTSEIRYMYPDDCGTKVTVPFHVHKDNVSKTLKYLHGKFIVEEDQLVEITEDNAEQYNNKVVHLRSPLGCRYTDGVCKICMGRLSDYITPDTSPGPASVIEMMSPTSQLILSNKHFVQTNSEIYSLPQELSLIMKVVDNDIYFREDTNTKNMVLGVPSACVERISDLQHIEHDNALNDQIFSSIQHLFIFTKTKETLLEAPMVDYNKTTPYFSSDMLLYIRDNPDKVTIGDTVWIDLDAFDRHKPFMKYIIQNVSMVEFTSRIGSLYAQRISNYTSASSALRDLTNITYTKVMPNIAHIETIIRANMIRDPVTYYVPIIKDAENVRFGTLSKTIIHRAEATQLANQNITEWLADPLTYIVPKYDSVYGPFVGYYD